VCRELKKLTVLLLLRPRKFIYKNIQKRRGLRRSRPSQLVYGDVGLRLVQPLRLNSKQIFRYKLFLKKAVRKSDKTGRKAWFNVFPYLPLSKKVAGSRMGKGKGKLAGWSADLPAGLFMLEMKNLRPGRALYYCNQVAHKLPVKSSIHRKCSVYTSTAVNSSVRIRFSSF